MKKNVVSKTKDFPKFTAIENIPKILFRNSSPQSWEGHETNDDLRCFDFISQGHQRCVHRNQQKVLECPSSRNIHHASLCK